MLTKVNLLCFLRCTTIQTTVSITTARITIVVIGTTTDTITTVFLFEVAPSVEDPNSGAVVWLTPFPVVGPSLVVVIKAFCVVVSTGSPPVVMLI